ncbi:MAG TPA: hypothetical protein VKG45_10085 [Actinomycetes bacterium]|nr:hypothetical protein [Actinomycetes bacterium]
MLTDELRPHYGDEHRVWIYEAAQLPICAARMTPVPLGRLSEAEVRPSSTLCVPPLKRAAPNPAIYQRLGLPAPVDTVRPAAGG